MAEWWVARLWQESPVSLVSWVVWVLGSIVLHELGHGWAALRAGDNTPRTSGHMTWNPVVHMGHMSLIAFAVFGLAWGQMPVDPSRFRRRFDDVIVSLAGPVMNLVLFAVAIAGLIATLTFRARLGEPLGENLVVFWSTGAMLNMALALFNMLPVPPFDGSRLVAHFSRRYARFWDRENAQVFMLIGMLVAFVVVVPYVVNAANLITVETARAGLRLVGRAGGQTP